MIMQEERPRTGSADSFSAGSALLLDRARAGVVGIGAWVVTTPTIVLGSAQRGAGSARLVRDGSAVSVARRATGGGAVLCDGHLLIAAVAVPSGHPWAGSDVTEAYRPIAGAIAAYLTAGGTPAVLASPDALSHGTEEARIACWAGVGPYEVLVEGRKLVGLSQRRRGGAVLFEMGIPVSAGQDRLTAYLDLEPGRRDAVEAALARTTCLAELGEADGPAGVWRGLRSELLRAVAG